MKCYANYKRAEDITLPATSVLSVLGEERTRERFWAKVRRTNGCWLWMGSLTGQLDHGQFHIARIAGRLYHEYAHRVSWILHHGPIPTGMQVNHHCDVPQCVRPDHLYLGTQGDNVRDGYRRQRYPLSRKWRKMTDEQVIECRQLRAAGWPIVQLADRYGVSKSNISLVCSYRRRTHLRRERKADVA
jgi:hypothetical protein